MDPTPVSEMPKVDVEVVAAPDPVVELQQLREDGKRWKGRFIAACVAFAFLLFVSVLQFVGTFVTCNLLHVARRDAERAQKETGQLIKELIDARGVLDQATSSLREARVTISKVSGVEAELRAMETLAERLRNRGEIE